MGYLVSLEWMHSFMWWRHTTSTTNNKTIRKQWGITLPRSGYWTEELWNWCLSRWKYTLFLQQTFLPHFTFELWRAPIVWFWGLAIHLFSMLLWLVVLSDTVFLYFTKVNLSHKSPPGIEHMEQGALIVSGHFLMLGHTDEAWKYTYHHPILDFMI